MIKVYRELANLRSPEVFYADATKVEVDKSEFFEIRMVYGVKVVKEGEHDIFKVNPNGKLYLKFLSKEGKEAFEKNNRVRMTTDLNAVTSPFCLKACNREHLLTELTPEDEVQASATPKKKLKSKTSSASEENADKLEK